MARIVMKFGGTSVADISRIRNVARHVKREVDAGHEVAVVVSAMAGKTNELVGWTRETSPLHDAREYDAVVASGEQVTAGLLAIALQSIGVARALLAGLADPDPDRQRAWRRAHHRHRRGVPDQALRRGPGGGRRRLPGARAPTTASPRSGAAAPTPAPWRSPRRSRPTAATSIPTSTASTPPTRASSRRRAGWPRFRSRKCSKWPRSAPRCCRCARSSWPWCTGCAPSCAPPSRTRMRPAWAISTIRPERSFATRMKSWNSRSSPASPTPRTKPRSRCAASPTGRAWRRAFSGRWPRPTSMST